MSDEASRPRLLVLAPSDNVATAIRDLEPGERVEHGGVTLTIASRVALGHKVALRPIAAGEKVIKFGAPIGSATCAIAAGEHVHTHNMKSDYLPPFGRDGASRGYGAA